MDSVKDPLTLGFLVALVVSACAPGGAQTSSDANALDVDTGPCSCRTAEDEMSTCCRSAMQIICQCAGNFCHEQPTGRQCRSSQQR